MTHESSSARKARFKRWLRRAVYALAAAALVVLLTCAVLAIAVATGIPQRKILSHAVRTALDAEAEIGGTFSVLGGVELSSLNAYRETDGVRDEHALIGLEGLALAYDVWPDDGRYFPSLRIDSLAVHWDGSPLLVAGQREEKGGSPLPFIPREVAIDSIRLGADLDTVGAAIDGLRIEATIETLRKFRATLNGDAITGSWRMGPREGEPETVGIAIDVRVEQDKRNVAIDPLRIDVPGLLNVAGAARLTSGGGKTVANIDFERLLIQAIDLSALDPGLLPVPFRLERFDMSGAHIEARHQGVADVTLADTHFDAMAEGLAVGPEDAPFYEGGLAIRGVSTPGRALDFDLDTTLSNGATIHTHMEGNAFNLAIRTEFDTWARSDIEALTPRDFQGYLSSLPALKEISSATVDIGLGTAKGTVSASVKALLGAESAELALNAKGSPLALLAGGNQSYDMDGSLRVAGGTVSLVSKINSAAASKATLELDNVNPARWASMLAGEDFAQSLDMCIGGTVDIEASADMKTIATVFDLAAPPFAFETISLPEGEGLVLKGSGTVDASGYPRAEGPVLEVRLGEAASITLGDWAVDFASFEGKMDVTGKVDLGAVGGWLGVDEMRGDLSFTAPVRNTKGYINAPIDLVLETLVYGGIAAPYGTPITANGVLEYDNINNRGNGTDWRIAVGEGTALTCQSWTAVPRPLAAEAAYAFETDFVPFVDMGLLAEAKGTAKASGKMSLADGAPSGDLELDVRAGMLALADAVAVLTGVSLKGGVAYAPGASLSGSAEFAADSVLVAGAAIEGVTGPAAFEGDAVKCTGIRGTLFGGAITADAEIGVLRDGFPIKLTAHFEGLDLDKLMSEMAPPSAKITGKASGDLTVAYGASGIEEVRLTMTSSDGFAVSTALLEQHFAAKFAESFGEKRVDRVMVKLFGKEELCPFDAANFTLALWEDRVVGDVVLRKEERSYTVSPSIDLSAVTEALKLLQRNRVEDIVDIGY